MGSLNRGWHALLFFGLTSALHAQQYSPQPTGEVYRQPSSVLETRSYREPPVSSTDGHGQARSFTPLVPSSTAEGSKRPSKVAPFSSVTGSLAIVLSVFGLCIWVLRRTQTASKRALPKGVFEVLGQGALVGRHHALLVRCGNRILLIGVSPQGTHTLAEFSESAEIHQIAATCKSGDEGSFQKTLEQLGEQRPARGFLGSLGSSPTAPSTRLLFPST
jgi:flagellar biogenesis protein FliO